MPYLWPCTISCFPTVSVKYIFFKLEKRLFCQVFTFLFIIKIYSGVTEVRHFRYHKVSVLLIFANFSACLLCNFLTVKSVSLAPVPPFISTNLVPHFAGGNNFFLHSFLCHLIGHWRRKNYLLLKLQCTSEIITRNSFPIFLPTYSLSKSSNSPLLFSFHN